MIAPEPERRFDLSGLLRTVFDPQPGEKALVVCDTPTKHIADNHEWAERRAMAAEWRKAFDAMGVPTLPLLTYPATGSHNAELPAEGLLGHSPVRLVDTLEQANLIIAMTEFSATAPLSRFVRPGKNGRRIVSMPGVTRSMEKTALAADYRVVAARARKLRDLLHEATAAEVVFSTGHRVTFDLRYRQAHADDGLCTPEKQFPLINLPSGEAYKVPYEGERDEPSATEGTIPLVRAGTLICLQIRENRIVDVVGEGRLAQSIRAYFQIDPARSNVAEFGLGCNPWARVSGHVLEDEKAGFHWAYGRSEHLGGTVGPDRFLQPQYVVHRDEVYAAGTPIGVSAITICQADGQQLQVMQNNRYLIFD